MFTKTEIRTALNVALDMNRDDTERECSFSYMSPTSITFSVYPHGKKGTLQNHWTWSAYHTDSFILYERICRNNIYESKKFPSFKAFLADVKEAAT